MAILDLVARIPRILVAIYSPAPSPLQIKQFADVGELLAEGKGMGHCIGSYADRVVRGKMFVFRVRYEQERLTLALGKERGRLYLWELAGKRNRPASCDANKAIRKWIDAFAACESEDS